MNCQRAVGTHLRRGGSCSDREYISTALSHNNFNQRIRSSLFLLSHSYSTKKGSVNRQWSASSKIHANTSSVAAGAATVDDTSDTAATDTSRTKPSNSSSESRSFKFSSIFSKSKSQDSTILADIQGYPYLLRSQASMATPTLWAAIKEKQLLAAGEVRGQRHLPSAFYPFPHQFTKDASDIVKSFFESLSNPETCQSDDHLLPLMVRGLKDEFIQGRQILSSRGLTPTFNLLSTPKVRMKAIHFTYGPFPPPADHALQDWLGLLTLVVPPKDAVFESLPHQRKVLKQAMDQGVYMRISTQVDANIEFVITKADTGLVLLRDRREWLNMQFVSPHFTPYDEVFERDGGNGWKLQWQWRVAELDGLMQRSGRTESSALKPKFDFFDNYWEGDKVNNSNKKQ